MKWNKKTKRITFGIITCVCVVGIACVLSFKTSTFSLTIDQTAIDQEEYTLMMNKNVSTITSYFAQTYEAKVDQDFWGQQYGDESPLTMLCEQTIEDIKENRAIYELAKASGFIDDDSFSAFIERKDAENKKRKEMKDAGKPVYGLSEYSDELFLEYEKDLIEKEYCRDDKREGMQVSDIDIQTFYDQNKDKKFKKNDDMSLQFVKIYYASLDLSQDQIDDMKKQLQQAHDQISISSLQDVVQTMDNIAPYYDEITATSSEISAYAKEYGDVFTIAENLEKGDLSTVVDENGCLYLIQCSDRVKYDYIPMQEVKDNIVKELREERYQEIITTRMKDMDVSYDTETLYTFTKKQRM